MSDRVDVRVGDITRLELGDALVDHVWTQHVTAEVVEVLRRMLEAPPPGVAPPILSAALFIDDLQTKATAYFRNMAEGRTALALAMCTAV